MIVLNPRYYGLICRCNNCGALLGYKPEDIHANSYVNCPQCGFEILTKMQLNYDGIVKEGDKGNGETVVRKQSRSGESDSRV